MLFKIPEALNPFTIKLGLEHMILELYQPSSTKWFHDAQSRVHKGLVIGLKLSCNLVRKPSLEFVPEKFFGRPFDTHIEWL